MLNKENKSRFVVGLEIKEQQYINDHWVTIQDGYSSWARIADMATSEEAEKLSFLLHKKSEDLLDWTNPQKEFDILKK